MPEPAKLLRLHFCESDKHDGKPLYEAVIDKCRELRIAGATVFRGLEGYGDASEIHRAHLFTHDQPVVVVIVDTPENITRALPVFAEMMGSGLIATSEVEMRRVREAGE